LTYLHNQGILHRDIKPDNILLSNDTEDAEPLICDFGFSTKLSEGETCTELCGTKGYMAPEILSRQPYSFPVDIWSFGVMLYALMSVRLPFLVPNGKLDENNVQIAYEYIIQNELNFNGQEWEPVSDHFKDLVRGMLDIDPTKRPSAVAVLNHPWMQIN